jgi:drug/metabolite transporter (DMT)-like permease
MHLWNNFRYILSWGNSIDHYSNFQAIMIQRIQTIWLLLAAAASLATLKFSFYSGVKDNNLYSELNGTANFALLLISVAVALAAAAAIFLYKNRKLQLQICLLGILLQIAAIVIYFIQVKKYTNGNFTITSVLTFLIPVLFILALLGIRKDEKLIKSMDRLR